MKKFWLACTMVIAVGISGCVDSDKDLYQEAPEKESNPSDFSTTTTVQANIDYAIADSKVPFYIYDKDPLIEQDGSSSFTLNENIKYLDAARTDENGKFNGELNLPSYVSDVYIISTAFNVPARLKGKIENGILKIASESDENSSTRAVTRRTSYSYDNNRFNRLLGWHNNLGSFDSKTGMIDYAYTGKETELTLSKTELTNLRNTVYAVLNRAGTCPEDYRTSADLRTKDDNTAVVLTAIGGETCWNNSLGYYYYKDKAPASIETAKVFTIFPNAQTYWQQNGLSSYPRGVKEGTAVKLLFYGEDGQETVGKNFPAGYKIGFVLACNAWNTYFTGYASHTQTGKYYSSSTKGLSSAITDKIDVHTAMFKDKKSGNIAIAFEDFKDDQNFTDVVFALKSNPEIEIDDKVEVDPDLNTTIEKTGVYAFEDEWPAAKDYDMNDVIAQYTYQKTFDADNKIVKESFTFKTFENWAVFRNGLGFVLNNAGTATPEDSIRYSGDKKFTPIKFTHEDGNVVILTKNVKDNINAEYKVSLDYGKDSKKVKETTVNPFIFREESNNLRREIHCPMQRPTVKADVSFFGQMDDRSVPEEGKYYVSDKDNIYPFAFYLNNATVEDITPLLDKNNEKKAISELYPGFIDWAKFGKNPDWYKKK